MTTPTRDRWCHHIEPAAATIECSGERHRIVWRRGKVVLENHDLGAEQTMLAFGGETPACLKTLMLWRNLHSWALSIELFRQMQSRLGADALLGPGDLAEVHQLGLVLSWDRAWRKLDYYTEHGRLLQEQLQDKAMAPLREHLRFWARQRGSRRVSSAKLEVARAGPTASMTGEMDSVGVRATATLGARWLVDVWGRGLALVDGAFVLEVDDEVPDRGAAALRVQAVRWDEHPAEPGRYRPVVSYARVEALDDRGWALTWEP